MKPLRYAGILHAFSQELWAIEPGKLAAIVDFLRLAASGELQALDMETRLQKSAEKQAARQSGNVAVMPLHGVIAHRMSLMDDFSGGTSAEKFGKQFDAFLADPAVKAIVLDVNSPGGSVSGTAELATQIHAARGTKPIVAHVSPQAASAAFWISAAADEIVMDPSASIGSVGVLAVHDDVSKMLEGMGVSRTLLSAGKFKVEGNPFEPLSSDARAHFQERIDEAHGMFVKSLATSRSVTQAHVRERFGQGRMVSAGDAIDRGMADSVGTMADVLSRFGVNAPAASTAKRAIAVNRERRALALRARNH